MNNIFTYKVYGLTIRSLFQIPELQAHDKTIDNVDIEISFGSVATSIENITFKGIVFEASNNALLLNIDNVARYLIENGNKITIEKKETATYDEVRLFLLGSAFAAILHQRGFLPLHGSTVKIDNKCVVFCGVSGAGKSTLAAEFVKQGYSILNDDVCAIQFQNNMPVAFPGYPFIKLWKDTIKHLDIEDNTHNKLRPCIEKYGINASTNFCNETLPVQAIYVLTPANTDNFEIVPIKGIEKFNVLKNQTYRFAYVKGLKVGNNHFNNITKLASTVEIKRLIRPSKGFQINKLVQLVLQDISKSNNQ